MSRANRRRTPKSYVHLVGNHIALSEIQAPTCSTLASELPREGRADLDS